MTDDQQMFIRVTADAANKAHHIFPVMAACEAALESAWGKSGLAREDANLFGMKAHFHNVYKTHILPTREFENGEWVTTNAKWIHYPSVASCFFDRMATLTRLSTYFPNYAAALAAKTAEDYVTEVSKSWSTDPNRAEKVIAIYRDYMNQTPQNA